MTARALFILDSDYDSLAAKGVIPTALVRDENGLFEHVYTAHPFALHNREIALSDNHTMIEFRQRQSASPRLILWIKYLSHLTHVTIALTKLVRRNKIDIIRAQDPYYCGLIGWLVSRLTGARFCVSIHTDYERAAQLDPVGGVVRIFGSRYLSNKLERFVLGRAERVLAISNYIGNYAQDHGANPAIIRIFRHRVGLGTFLEKHEVAKPTRPVIAVVSRLTDQKHIMDIPGIARALKVSAPGFVIEIAGDGEARQKLEIALAAAEVQDHVRLLGFQNTANVRDLLNRATAYLSLCSGAALIEAGASGTPVVAYDWEWHSEIVINGQTGLLTPENDIDETATALVSLIQNPERASTMGQSMREHTLIMFDDQRLLESRRSVYRELLSADSFINEATSYQPEEIRNA